MGSSVNILFKVTLDEMGIADLKMEPSNTSLKGFGGRRLMSMGVVELLTISLKAFGRTMMLDFVVVDKDIRYQIILKRPFLRISKSVISNYYLALKYQVNGMVWEL